MRTAADLHPDDTDLRVRLGAELRQARIDAGLSQRDLARILGVNQAVVASMEARLTWRVRTLYRHARALGRTLTVCVDGRPVTGGTDVARCRTAVLRISIARQVSGLSEREVADRLGVVESVVRSWESGGDNPSLIGLQRHARAVGVPVDVYLEAS